MQIPVQVNINLLPREPVNRWRWYYWGLSLALMLILGGLTAYYDVSRGRELNHLQVVNADLKAQVNEYEQEIAQTIPLDDVEKLINQKYQEIKLVEISKQSYVDVWDCIDRAVPAQVLVVEVEINAKKVFITGFSPDHEQLAGFLQSLERNPNFKNVVSLSTRMDERSNEVSFSIEVNWGPGKLETVKT